jgi:hypothetical protein
MSTRPALKPPTGRACLGLFLPSDKPGRTSVSRSTATAAGKLPARVIERALDQQIEAAARPVACYEARQASPLLLAAHRIGRRLSPPSPSIHPESGGSIPRKRAYGPLGAVLRGSGVPGGVWNLCPHLWPGCPAPPRKVGAGSAVGGGCYPRAGKGKAHQRPSYGVLAGGRSNRAFRVPSPVAGKARSPPGSPGPALDLPRRVNLRPRRHWHLIAESSAAARHESRLASRAAETRRGFSADARSG